MEEPKKEENDQRLLEASAKGQTDLVLQLIEEEGQHLHGFKDKVRSSEFIVLCVRAD